MSKENEIKRREFLELLATTGAGVLFGPRVLEMLIPHAHAAGEGARRYIGIQMSGAPPRWMYDLILNPYDQANYQQNPMIATQYTASGNRYTGSTYAEVTRQGIKVPPIWSLNLPSPGGSVAAASLLADLCLIRGIDTMNAGHSNSQALHQLPLRATTSINALSADASNAPIGLVDAGTTNLQFVSQKNSAFVSVPGTADLITHLTQPVRINTTDAWRTVLDRVSPEMEAVVEQAKAEALARDPASQSNVNALSSAQSLSKRNFGDTKARFDSLAEKYERLISRALSLQIPGLNDKPIGVPPTQRDRTYQLNGTIIMLDDLRSLVKSTTTIKFLSARFALCEYAIVNELTRSFSFDCGPLTDLAGPEVTLPQDQHTVGVMVGTFLNTLYYAAFSACLAELIAQLKAASMWNNTVIDVAGEFNRTPRLDKTGADHGFKGASVALYSGAIDGPLIIGDIKAASEGGLKTWGQSAPNRGSIAGRVLSTGDFAASLATLLRVGSPMPATYPSLLKESNGRIVKADGVPDGRIVA